MKNFNLKIAIAFVFLFVLTANLMAQETVIKFATLAPEGSTWMKILIEWNKEVMKRSSGNVRFRIYSGGVSGDEKDVVRKIRLGQLHGGGFTGVGLGEIAPKVRILDTPFLFETSAEVDYIASKFHAEFDEEFKKNGYVLLGWAEVGFVYFYTAARVQTLNDLKGTKLWMWEGDPVAEATFKALGLSPIPLSITDVMTSLQTGLIDGVYSSPLAIVGLQWFTKTKYMFGYPLANAQGAVLVSKPFFDKMPKDQQDLLVETGKKYLGQLTALSRKDNTDAIQALKRSGIQEIAPASKAEIDGYKQVGEKARAALAGKLYPKEFLSSIEKSLLEYRSKKK